MSSSPLNLTCAYRFNRGNMQGEICQSPILQNSIYCKRHIDANEVVKLLETVERNIERLNKRYGFFCQFDRGDYCPLFDMPHDSDISDDEYDELKQLHDEFIEDSNCDSDDNDENNDSDDNKKDDDNREEITKSMTDSTKSKDNRLLVRSIRDGIFKGKYYFKDDKNNLTFIIDRNSSRVISKIVGDVEAPLTDIDKQIITTKWKLLPME